MKRKNSTKVLAVLLTLVMIFSAIPATVITAVGEFTAPKGMYTISNTKRQIAPGVTENKIVTNKTSGNEQVQSYAVTVEMSEKYDNTLAVGYADYQGTEWKLQTVRNQAAAFEKKTGKNVVAAMNADIYNMQTGEPHNSLVMGGVVYKAALNSPYFAIMKDGTPKIGRSLTKEILDNAREVVGGFYTLVEGGELTSSANNDYFAPKIAVGIKSNGDVILYAADGRNAPVSVGLNNIDTARIMQGLGCVDVLNLDGGGSATYAAQYEGSNSLVVANRPSDGVERAVSSSLFVISNAKPTGEFDHASLQPNDQLYTPGAAVDFTATGVDGAGGSAPLPADGKFVLADNSFGAISEDGKFVSNGKTGTVEVNYVSNGTVCGSTSIEIVVPDEFFVTSNEQAVGPGATTDFGIVAKYKDRDVVMCDDDIKWSITDSSTGEDLNGKAGLFSGLIFTGAEDGAFNAKVVAAFKSNESVNVELTVFIGSKQVKLFDFEYTDDKEEAENNPNLRYMKSLTIPNIGQRNYGGYWVNGDWVREEGYDLFLWPNRSLDNDVATGTIVSSKDGEPVRFGDHSLRIQYDYSTFNYSSNANIYLCQTREDFWFEGAPTGIGCWVYAPEGTTGYNCVINCAGKYGDSEVFQAVSRIDWTGWKYLEMDLTGVKNYGLGVTANNNPDNLPFGYYSGSGIFWINFIPKEMGKPVADTIYIDDMTLIYGANTSDTINPEIKYIGSLTDQIEDGKTVYTSNVNTIKASYDDVEDKYMTGIDNSKTKMYIDGIDVTDRCYINDNDNEIYLYDAYLANGSHNVEIEISDKFDNRTTETRYFTVDAEKEEDTVVEFKQANGAPVLGQDYELSISTNNPADISSLDVVVKVLSIHTKYWRDVKVVPADGFELDGEAKYNSVNDTLSFKIVRSAEETRSVLSTDVAKIITHVPLNTPDFLEVTHRISKGKITFTDEKGSSYVQSFSGKISATCESAIFVDSDTMVKGSAGGNIYVKDKEGLPVADAEVYSSDNEFVGKTNENGELFTDKFVNEVKSFSIHAKKDDMVSFIYKSQCFNDGADANGNPLYIKLGVSNNPESTQSITWLSSVAATKPETVVAFAEKAEYEKNGVLSEFIGVNDVSEMSSSASVEQNYAVRINRATLTDLKANTEYVYKVGDGEKMSELKSFKTTAKGAPVNFFVIGDTQATDTTNTDNIKATLANSGKNYAFGIQTGDFVDNGGNYIMWENIAKVFSDSILGSTSMIQVLGNHEYYGDDTGANAGLYFNLPGATTEGAPDCYSTQYGNVYVAVINYGSEKSYEEAAKWIKADAAKSSAQWKILTVHQPAYTTNPGGTTLDTMRIFRSLCDEVGFDIMFSGHDHSYARTKPMVGGKVNEEGTTYYICGSTGEKSYDIIKNDNYNFDCLDGEYNAIFLTVSATDTTLEVTTYDQQADGANIIDTFSKTKNVNCSEVGHKATYKDGKLYCGVCNYPLNLESYSGFATNGDNGGTMYIIGGEVKTGWMVIGDDAYYFGEDGCAATGEDVTIDGIGGYNFDKDGKQIDAAFVTDAKGVTRAYRGGQLIKGWWTNSEGDIYYFSRSDGAMRRGETTITFRTNQKLDVVFSEDGKLLKGALYETEDGTVYYWGSEMVSGWWEIDGSKYYFDPDTHYMAVGNATIDGKEYAFSQYGSLVHEGFHTYADMDIVTMDPSCTIDGKILHICTKCFVPIEEKIPALGHVDKNNDGKCDRCGDSTEKNKPSTIEEILYNLFARIIAFYRNLSNLIKNGFKQIGK